MATECFGLVWGKRIRVTELDACGVPVPGGANAVTDGFVSVGITSETADPVEISVTNASGVSCYTITGDASFTRFTMSIEFCMVNPAVFTLLTNMDPYSNYAGDVAGVQVLAGPVSKNFALEIWSGVAGAATECGDLSGAEPSVYNLLPFLRAGVLSGLTINGTDAVTFTVEASFTQDFPGWGVGPYNVIEDLSGAPAPLPTAVDPRGHLLQVRTLVPPPEASCEPGVVPLGPSTGTLALAAP